VLVARLQRAHAILRDAHRTALTISVIAYDVGFGDLSYFNRAFRREFRATPSDIRASRRSG
jgi:AraC-like DNA-binding protein